MPHAVSPALPRSARHKKKFGWMRHWKPILERGREKVVKIRKFGYRTTGRGKRTHLIQYFNQMINRREQEYNSTMWGNADRVEAGTATT